MQIKRTIRRCLDLYCDLCHEIVKTAWFLAGCYIITEIVTKPLIECVKIYYK
jgi:hypothetical protein